eukprot:TRINITY_DN710_c0_g1_i1.p1 TRINITY_DN710_c0_g1~~TRINITY_DN710_c0_g1_i1.p1  ORF type:complete len:202 (+),score=32.34 TRINITY_DN710_c0_g1_i1:163-768(+)
MMEQQYQYGYEYDFMLSTNVSVYQYTGMATMTLFKSALCIPYFQHWTASFHLHDTGDTICLDISGKNFQTITLEAGPHSHEITDKHNQIVISKSRPKGEKYEEMGVVPFNYFGIIEFCRREVSRAYNLLVHNCQDFVNDLGRHLGIEKSWGRLDVGDGVMVVGASSLVLAGASWVFTHFLTTKKKHKPKKMLGRDSTLILK